MSRALTDDQRRWLGTAVAMSAADGFLADEERELIAQICRDLDLSDEARTEVVAMLNTPPSPVELASWAITADDRPGLYAAALKMASADGVMDPAEERLLSSLAAVLKLTPEELSRARAGVEVEAPE